MSIIDLLTGAGTGGLIGGALALGNTWLTARIRKDERSHELQVMQLSAAQRITAEEWASFRASQEAGGRDDSSPSYAWVGAVRSLTRPTLTIALVAAAVAVYGTVPTDMRSDIGRDLLMLAGTAVGWWFGARPTLQSVRK